ncbi:PAS domain S-box protein [Oscillatoriales cyanobacterium LEGE 11467]|uniref:PAS domain S-box protein n=1 Tax=Zarconia navalis LEGE 11467 TaxID=1828826 RepID=A0A928Z989_9CYAN|nr:PAS domain-containing protein [Zarconia navalis]MBE9042385.1 PAS domain S-box protein [Zarconia navalis LEGE 11467]
MKLARQDSDRHRARGEVSLQAFFNLSLDLLCVRSADGYFLELNAVWTKTLGWTLEELRSRPWLEFVHLGDVDMTQEMEDIYLATRMASVMALPKM